MIKKKIFTALVLCFLVVSLVLSVVKAEDAVNTVMSSYFDIADGDNLSYKGLVVFNVVDGSLDGFGTFVANDEQGVFYCSPESVGNLTVSVPSGFVVTVNNIRYYAGDSQEYTITPSAHYHLVATYVNNVSLGVVSSVTFTNIQSNHNITAVFALDTLDIEAFQTDNGVVSPSGVTSVNYGSK